MEREIRERLAQRYGLSPSDINRMFAAYRLIDRVAMQLHRERQNAN